MKLEDLCHRIDRKMDKDVQSVYQSKSGNAHMTERSHVGTQGRPVKACVVEHGDPSIDEEIEIFEDKKTPRHGFLRDQRCDASEFLGW